MQRSTPKSARDQGLTIAAEALIGPRQPRTERHRGVIDPDETVQPRAIAVPGRALDHPATRSVINKRAGRLLIWALLAIGLFAAGVVAAIEDNEPGLLVFGIVAVAWSFGAVVWFAKSVRVLRRGSWLTWPAAHMLVSPSTSGLMVPKPMGLSTFNWWAFQLFDFANGQRFLMATPHLSESRRNKFDDTQGKVWACGDPSGEIVLSPDGGTAPTLFNARFSPMRREFIAAEFAAQFPPGRPSDWGPVSEETFGEQVKYEGSIVWPSLPGKTDDFDHDDAKRRRWRRDDDE